MADTNTPQERDDKAAILAAEMRRFQWEVRFYVLGLIIFILANEVFG